MCLQRVIPALKDAGAPPSALASLYKLVLFSVQFVNSLTILSAESAALLLF